MKRVIVAYQNQIVMDTTLEGGLDRIFGAGATAGMRLPTDVPGPGQAVSAQTPRRRPQPVRHRRRSAGTPPALSEQMRTLTAEARDHYQRALDAQRQGNWALYGDEIKRLGEVLERMESARERR